VKYDTQITLAAAGTCRTLQVCLDYEVRLPEAANSHTEEIEVFGAHVFTGRDWQPFPRFWGMLSDGQRGTIMADMIEAWHSAKGLPTIERAGK
jgi:hypothetical protein